jgi:hypothetical protein
MQQESNPETGITVTRRNLPHWTKRNAVYWITFRLADSLSRARLDAWKAERELWGQAHPLPWTELEWREYDRQFGQRLENWLDGGYGSCVLARPEAQTILQGCLLRFDGERLFLRAGVIMPNHVHLLLELLQGCLLSILLKGIKGASAREINRVLGRAGRLWQDESYDHIVRSEGQYRHLLRYIAHNPVRAGLRPGQYWLYLPQHNIM